VLPGKNYARRIWALLTE